MRLLKLMPVVFMALGCEAPQPRASRASADLQRFTVGLQGQNVGYMTMTVTEQGPDSLLVTQDMMWVINLLGTERRVTMNSSARTGRDLDLGAVTMEMSDGTSDIRVSAVRRGGVIETEIETSGRRITRSVESGDGYLPAFMDLAAAGMQWAPGDERVYDTFDPTTGSIIPATVTCLGIEEADLLGDVVRAAKLRVNTAGMSNLVWVWEGQVVREEEPGLGLTLTRVTPDTDGSIVPAGDLYLAYSVPSPVIENPRSQGERTWSLEGDIDWSIFTLDYPGLQSSRPGPLVTVCARLPQESMIPPFPMPEVSGDLEEHLMPEPLIQCDDPAIKALADSLTAGAADAWAAASAICRYVDLAVEDVPTVSLPSAVDVLDAMRGDCNEHTALFVALARAAGIPSAVCNGIVYIDHGRFGYHAWPAVWVGDWVAMDPTFGMPVADATHIILAMGSLEDQYAINAVIGRLSVREVRD